MKELTDWIAHFFSVKKWKSNSKKRRMLKSKIFYLKKPTILILTIFWLKRTIFILIVKNFIKKKIQFFVQTLRLMKKMSKNKIVRFKIICKFYFDHNFNKMHSFCFNRDKYYYKWKIQFYRQTLWGVKKCYK